MKKLLNTLYVSALGIVLATALGTVMGIARLSSNWLIRKLAQVYVETFRNVPLLLWLVFTYAAIRDTLPRLRDGPSLLWGWGMRNTGLSFVGPGDGDLGDEGFDECLGVVVTA